MLRKKLPLSILFLFIILTYYFSVSQSQTFRGKNYPAVTRDANGNTIDIQNISLNLNQNPISIEENEPLAYKKCRIQFSILGKRIINDSIRITSRIKNIKSLEVFIGCNSNLFKLGLFSPLFL